MKEMDDNLQKEVKEAKRITYKREMLCSCHILGVEEQLEDDIGQMHMLDAGAIELSVFQKKYKRENYTFASKY